MKLYGSYTSPYVRHCRIALLETQQKFEFVEADRTVSTKLSPTQRVPFLQDGALFLSDSTSILKHIRQKAGQDLCPSVVEMDMYCMANTLLDTSINLYLLQLDGVTTQQSAYLARQQARIDTSLAVLNKMELPSQAPYTDAQLCLACYLDWVQFRQLKDLSPYPVLAAFVQAIQKYAPFAATTLPK